MRTSFTPTDIHPGFGRYHQAVEVTAGQRLLFLSGLLGIRLDDTVPEKFEDQVHIVFAAIDACLAQARMGREHIVHMRTYLVDGRDRPSYMRMRDAWVSEPVPASTLLLVGALVDPAFKVEIEVVAAAP